MRCGICGQDKECKEILSDTFTDLDNLKSKVFCDNCIKLFDNQWLKTAFYWTKKEKRKCQQKDFENVLKNIEFPCLLSFSESRKKHRLFRTKWSYSRREVYISTDTGEVCLNLDRDMKLFDYLLKFYSENKVSKEWMKMEIPTGAIKKIGLEKYLEFQDRIKNEKGTAKFNLLIDFINKK